MLEGNTRRTLSRATHAWPQEPCHPASSPAQNGGDQTTAGAQSGTTLPGPQPLPPTFSAHSTDSEEEEEAAASVDTTGGAVTPSSPKAGGLA